MSDSFVFVWSWFLGVGFCHMFLLGVCLRGMEHLWGGVLGRLDGFKVLGGLGGSHLSNRH